MLAAKPGSAVAKRGNPGVRRVAVSSTHKGYSSSWATVSRFHLSGWKLDPRGTHGFVCDDSMIPRERGETRECHSEAKATLEFAAQDFVDYGDSCSKGDFLKGGADSWVRLRRLHGSPGGWRNPGVP